MHLTMTCSSRIHWVGRNAGNLSYGARQELWWEQRCSVQNYPDDHVLSFSLTLIASYISVSIPGTPF